MLCSADLLDAVAAAVLLLALWWLVAVLVVVLTAVVTARAAVAAMLSECIVYVVKSGVLGPCPKATGTRWCSRFAFVRKVSSAKFLSSAFPRPKWLYRVVVCMVGGRCSSGPGGTVCSY